MVDLAPEWVKEVTSRRRYEALIGAINGVHMNMEAAQKLINTYTPPRGHSWQVPTKTELKKEFKETLEAVNAFHRKVRNFEADLIAADWKVG